MSGTCDDGFPHRRLFPRWRRSHGIAAVILAVCLAVFYLHCRQYEVVQDDAYITFVYSKNLALGQGLVFNPGERVEGYTNFLWALLCALPHLTGVDVAVFAQVLGFLSTAGLLASAWILSGVLRPRRPPWSRVATVVLLAANGSLAFWSLSGMETSLFALLVTLGAISYLHGLRAAEPRWHTGALFGLATLTRPEGALFFLLTVLHRLALQAPGRRFDLRPHLPWILSFAVLVMPHLVFRLLYYGHLLPNTFHAKVGMGSEQFADGLRYAWKFLVDYGFFGLGLLAPLLLMRWRRQRPAHGYLALLVLGNAVWVIVAGGDIMAENRLFLPVLAILYVELQELGYRLVSAFRLALGPGRSWLPLSSGLVLLGLATAWTGLYARPQLLHARLATQAHNAKLHDLAGFIQTLPNPDRLLVACTAVGIPRYFTGAGVLDMVGLTDEVIARDPQPLPGIRDTHCLGHYNVRYVMDRVPDLIYFVTGERPVLQAEKALFLSRRFRQEYYLSYIADDRPVYVRRGRAASVAEEFAPSGEFIELYSLALDRSPAEEARNLFRQSISKAPPDFAYGHTWLGREYYDAGMIAPATVLFEQALVIDADVVMALAHLAVLRETSDRAAEAVDLARRAVLLAPRSHFCRYAYGRALLAVGRTEEGMAALFEALRLSDTAPSAADAGFRLGLVMYGRGEKDHARQIWQAVLRTDPSHPGARQGLRLLGGNLP